MNQGYVKAIFIIESRGLWWRIWGGYGGPQGGGGYGQGGFQQQQPGYGNYGQQNYAYGKQSGGGDSCL